MLKMQPKYRVLHTLHPYLSNFGMTSKHSMIQCAFKIICQQSDKLTLERDFPGLVECVYMFMASESVCACAFREAKDLK